MIKNGVDCGPDAASLLFKLIAGEVVSTSGRFDPEEHQCRHQTRYQLLDGICDSIDNGKQRYRNDPASWGDIITPDHDAHHLLWRSVRRTEKYGEVLETIRIAEAKCLRCRAKRTRPNQTFHPAVLGMEADLQLSKAGKVRFQLEHEPAVGNNAGEDVVPMQVEFEPDSEIAGSDDDEVHPFAPRKLYVGMSHMNPEAVKMRTIPQRARHNIQPMKIKNVPFRRRFLKDCIMFDDYYNGPTFEDVKFPVHPGLEAEAPAHSDWEVFQDWGYRILTESFQQFYLQVPSSQMIADHCFPVPPAAVRDACEGKSHMALSTLHNYSSTITSAEMFAPLPRTLIESHDSQTMSLAEICECVGADSMFTDAGLDLFVRGLIKVGEDDATSFVILEPALDGIKVLAEHITRSFDVDSVIWLTRYPKVATSISIHLLPFVGRLAPIHINNHTYVTLLFPRSDADRDRGGARMEWREKRVPLSHIPHTHFGVVGSSSSVVNMYVFFPRMMHRGYMNGRFEVKIPRHIEFWWLKHVVYPALQRIGARHPSVGSYIKFTEDEVNHKAGKKPVFKQLLTTEWFDELIEYMEEIMDDSDPALGLERFGSYFFVLDIRGCKLMTTSDDPQSTNAYERLIKEFKGLDWEYMMNRTVGELLVDIGVGFHPPMNYKVDPEAEAEISMRDRRPNGAVDRYGPVNTDGVGEPLIGLWKRKKADLSFDYGSFNAGASHQAANMADYGGRGSEMAQPNSHVNHVLFRQYYMLSYEQIRNQQTRDRLFFKASDAYALNETFESNTIQLADRFLAAKKRSFGVRDEMRVSGAFMKEALEKHLRGRVCVFHVAAKTRILTCITVLQLHKKAGPYPMDKELHLVRISWTTGLTSARGLQENPQDQTAKSRDHISPIHISHPCYRDHAGNPHSRSHLHPGSIVFSASDGAFWNFLHP